MLNNEINRIAYLNSLGKKPIDILLELIQIECFDFEFNTLSQNTICGKKITNILKDKYDITIADFIIEKWLKSKFNLINKKLVLKNLQNDLANEKILVSQKEKEFTDEFAKIRIDFQKYAKDNWGKNFNNEQVKEVFDSYIYSVSMDKNLDNLTDNNAYFIFKEYLKQVYNKNEVDKLNLIENFGVANQIRKIIINEENNDKKFLQGCILFIDTPIMMKLLGYDGKNLGDNYCELLKNLKNAGAILKIFEHTFEELWGILFSFKKCIAQNMLDTKGVNDFLKAKKEYSGIKDLSLDKERVRKEIEKSNFEICEAITEEDLNTSDRNKIWIFDSEKLKKIISENYIYPEQHKSRIENDVNSISAISRLRLKSNITKPHTYKESVFFLFVDNFSLIDAVNKYYTTEKIGKNELIFENSVLFELWQNLNDNNSLNKTLFRSKCFALNVIDSNFKEKLYKEARKAERYNPEAHTIENIIENPDIEEEIYAQSIKVNKYDEKYIKLTMENQIKIKNEENNKIIIEKDKEIQSAQSTISEKNLQIEQIKKTSEQSVIDFEEKIKMETKAAVKQNEKELINKQIEKLKNNKFLKLTIFFKKLFNKKFDIENFYLLEAKKKTGIE